MSKQSNGAEVQASAPFVSTGRFVRVPPCRIEEARVGEYAGFPVFTLQRGVAPMASGDYPYLASSVNYEELKQAF